MNKKKQDGRKKTGRPACLMGLLRSWDGRANHLPIPQQNIAIYANRMPNNVNNTKPTKIEKIASIY